MKASSIGYLAVAVSALLLVGCGDDKTPNKSNVKEALNDFLEKSPLCLPAVVSTEISLSEIDPSFMSLSSAYDPMVAAGFLTMTSHKEIYKDQKIASVSTSAEYEFNVRNYQLTDFGKMFYKPAGSVEGGIVGGRLCYANRSVESIESMSEVTEMQGKKVIHVQYTARLEQYPAWSKDSVIKAFPETLLTLEKAKHGTAVMVLTEKGWKHKDLTQAPPQ